MPFGVLLSNRETAPRQNGGRSIHGLNSLTFADTIPGILAPKRLVGTFLITLACAALDVARLKWRFDERVTRARSRARRHGARVAHRVRRVDQLRRRSPREGCPRERRQAQLRFKSHARCARGQP